MFTAKSFVCLDFGAGNVKAAEFEVNQAGSLSLKQFGLQALGLDGSQDSKREKALLAATRELLASRGLGGKPCAVCAPGFQVFSKVIKLPPVDAAKIKQIITYEARQNVLYALEEAVWDYQVLGANAAGEVEVLLAAVKTETVESLFRTAEGAGLKPTLVEASPAALANAFRFNYADLEGCTVLVDIGAKTSALGSMPGSRIAPSTTPISVKLLPSSAMGRPITRGSDPKRRDQSPRPMTATAGRPGRSSPGANVRPATALSPRTRKNSADTTALGTLSGAAPPVRLKDQSE